MRAISAISTRPYNGHRTISTNGMANRLHNSTSNKNRSRHRCCGCSKEMPCNAQSLPGTWAGNLRSRQRPIAGKHRFWHSYLPIPMPKSASSRIAHYASIRCMISSHTIFLAPESQLHAGTLAARDAWRATLTPQDPRHEQILQITGGEPLETFLERLTKLRDDKPVSIPE